MQRKLWVGLTWLLVFSMFLSGCGSTATPEPPTPTPPGPELPYAGKELNVIYMTQAGYQPDVFLARVKLFEEWTGANVSLTFVKYDEQHAKIVDSATAPRAIYDVFALDLIWTAEFAEKGYVLPLDSRIPAAMRADIAPAIWNAFEYNGQTWAMPFLANFQLFFYNEDYIRQAGFSGPPETLEELETQMIAMKEQGIVEYPWSDSWNQKEGLVCEYVWLTGAYGGDTFDERGNPVFNEGPGLQALETMVRWLELGLADPNSLVQDEPMAKDAFISGRTAFNSNWTFQYGLMLDPEVSQVVDSARMGLLPVSEQVYQAGSYETASVSGFQGMAITANTREPDLAWELVQWMTAPDFQARHLEEMPVWISVQTAPETLAADPVMDIKAAQIAAVHHRPKSPAYPQVSAIMQKYIHQALSGRLTPQEALDRAVAEINALY